MKEKIEKTEKSKKTIFNNLPFFIIIGLIAAFAVFEITLALPPNSPYSPGQTLDPNCSPGSENCRVIPPHPITTEFATNTIVNLNNYSLNWGPDFVYFDSANKRVGINKINPLKSLDIDGQIKGTGLCIADDCRTSWTTGTTSTGGGVSFSGDSVVPGTIAFLSGTSSIAIDPEFYWDNVNKRLGIGTNKPIEKLEVVGDIKANNVKTGGLCFSDGCKFSWASIIGIGNGTTTGITSTDQLAEGVKNLYYSASRAISDVKSNLLGTGITPNKLLTFDGTKIVSSNLDVSSFDTSALRSTLSGVSPIKYDKTTGTFSMEESVGIQNGGTGNNSFTANKFLIFDGTKIVSSNYDGSSFGNNSGASTSTIPNSVKNLHITGTLKIGQDGTDIGLYKIVQSSIDLPELQPQTAVRVNIGFPQGTIPSGTKCITHAPADLENNLMPGQCQTVATDKIAVMIHSLGVVNGENRVWRFAIMNPPFDEQSVVEGRQISVEGEQTSIISNNEGIIDSIKQTLFDLGIIIENKITKIKELIAEKITTKQLCIEENGEEICVNGSQLKDLLQRNNLEN